MSKIAKVNLELIKSQNLDLLFVITEVVINESVFWCNWSHNTSLPWQSIAKKSNCKRNTLLKPYIINGNLNLRSQLLYGWYVG